MHLVVFLDSIHRQYARHTANANAEHCEKSEDVFPPRKWFDLSCLAFEGKRRQEIWESYNEAGLLFRRRASTKWNRVENRKRVESIFSIVWIKLVK